MDVVNWIHISDLHFGYSEGVATRIFHDEAADYLCEYFKSVKQTPEYLFITGDIIFPKNNKRKITEHYENAKIFVLEIIQKLGISPKNVFIVPGNHDVSGEGLRFKTAQHIRAVGNYDFVRGEVSPSLNNEWKNLKPRKQFIDFYKDIRGEAFHCGHFLFSEKYVDILCLDTSLLSIGSKEDNNNLFIGSNKVMDVLEHTEKEKPKIVLAHHPLSFMKRMEHSNLVRMFVKRNVFAYFYGHAHSLGLELPTVLGNPDVPSSIDAICCPTHINKSAPYGMATVIGLVTGNYDISKEHGVATYHIWSIGSTPVKPELIDVPLCKKNKNEIEILEKTKEKIINTIESNFENAPYSLTEKVSNLFKEGMAQLSELAKKQLQSLKAEILITVNTPMGDTSGGRAVEEIEVGGGNQTDSENLTSVEKQLRIIKEKNL